MRKSARTWIQRFERWLGSWSNIADPADVALVSAIQTPDGTSPLLKSPEKSGDMTPTISNGFPLTRMSCPIAARSPPNIRCHRP